MDIVFLTKRKYLKNMQLKMIKIISFTLQMMVQVEQDLIDPVLH